MDCTRVVAKYINDEHKCNKICKGIKFQKRLPNESHRNKRMKVNEKGTGKNPI